MSSTRRKRMRWTLAIGTLLIAGVVFYIQFFLARPMGTGPAGPAVDLELFRQPWTNRPVRVVGIGDSITAGLGAASTDHTFFKRLIKNLSDEFPDLRNVSLSAVIPDLQFLNLAISGSTSCDHVNVVSERLPSDEPEVFGLVVMTTGGNDLIHSYGRAPPRECAMYGISSQQAAPWIEGFRQRLEKMLDTIGERFPGGCEIYLANIYDRGYDAIRRVFLNSILARSTLRSRE